MTSLPRLFLALGILLAACDDGHVASAPRPGEVTAESTGYFCGMLLSEHAGPKGQIHLAGRNEPLWFSSVRDTIAFTRMPSEARGIRAIYVNDMGKATDWAKPEPGTWIDARQAFFVVESGRRGGMGAREAVPFGEEAAARRFVAMYGGTVVRLGDIPDSYVLGAPDSGAPAESHVHATGEADGHRGQEASRAAH